MTVSTLTLRQTKGARLTTVEMDNNWLYCSDSSNATFAQSGIGAVSRTVSSKLSEWVSVTDFGAATSASRATNDTAFAAAIAAANRVFVPAGTFNTSAPIVLSAMSKALIGAGSGITTINCSSGDAIQVKSAGGVDSTKLRNRVADLTVTATAGNGLYVYDVADSIFERIEATGCSGIGISVEMNVDNTFSDLYSHDNTGDGIKLNAALKNSVEFTTNACQLRRCVSNTNTGNGLSITRSFANVIDGGEYSANANGIVLAGSKRNRVFGSWIENNTTDGINTAQSTSPTTFNSDDNIFDAMVAGTGNITIANGTQNIVAGYLAANLTISGTSATPSTTILPSFNLAGSLTDNGSATRDLRPTTTYIKQSTAKRYQRTIGSTVDYTSDIAAFRFAQLMSLSSTATVGSNFNGFKDIADANTSSAVAFSVNEPDASYGVWMTTWDVTGAPAANSHIPYMTSRAVSGFTINLVAAPGAGTTVRVFWMLVRM